MDFTRILTTPLSLWRGIRAYAVTHKVRAAIVIIVVLYGAYYIYGAFTAPSTATHYVTTVAATAPWSRR